MVTLKPPFRADDMQGLYKKVIKGKVPAIPKKFSTELLSIIRTLIQVDPKKRPTCDKILDSQIIKNKVKEYKLFEDEEGGEPDFDGEQSLLNTIYIPKSLQQLQERLPKASYIKQFSTPQANGGSENGSKSMMLPPAKLNNSKKEIESPTKITSGKHTR